MQESSYIPSPVTIGDRKLATESLPTSIATKHLRKVTGMTIALSGTPERPHSHISLRRIEEFMTVDGIFKKRRASSEAGFNLIDISIVLAVMMLVVALVLPQATASLRAFRVASDARSIASQLALVKMRAANGFTQARLNCDTTTNSCQVELCTSKGATACNTFTAEGGPINLSTGVSFGADGITTPAGTQSAFSDVTRILFNSRSIPIDNSGAATGDYALYLEDQYDNKYAVTVYATGRIAVWRYNGSSWSIQ